MSDVTVTASTRSLPDRLREWAKLVPMSEAGRSALEAADEIERLQRELDFAYSNHE